MNEFFDFISPLTPVVCGIIVGVLVSALAEWILKKVKTK